MYTGTGLGSVTGTGPCSHLHDGNQKWGVGEMHVPQTHWANMPVDHLPTHSGTPMHEGPQVTGTGVDVQTGTGAGTLTGTGTCLEGGAGSDR